MPPRRHELSTARLELISTIARAMHSRELSQVRAAQICGTDQPTLSKVLRGRTESVTLEKLMGWLTALGGSVEIHVGRLNSPDSGHLTVVVDE